MNSEAMLKVLIVDDHQMFADSLGRLLSDDVGIEVVGIAAKPTTALAMVETMAPHVVIVDYHMPERNGLLIASDIKVDHPAIKVLMLSGTIDDRLVVAAIEAGCAGFLTKDRGAEEVVTAVRAVAAGEILVSPAILSQVLQRLGRRRQAIGDNLTQRELQILGMLADGWANARIAQELHLSINTVRNYVQAILTKLNAHSKLEAVATAIKERVIPYPSDR